MKKISAVSASHHFCACLIIAALPAAAMAQVDAPQPQLPSPSSGVGAQPTSPPTPDPLKILRPSGALAIKASQQYSSANLVWGQFVEFTVEQDTVTPDGKHLIKQGTPVFCQVTDLRRGAAFRGGRLSLSTDRVRCTDGTDALLVGPHELNPDAGGLGEPAYKPNWAKFTEGTRPQVNLAGAIVPAVATAIGAASKSAGSKDAAYGVAAITFLGSSSVGGLIQGPDAVINQGSVVSVRIWDPTVPAPVVQSSDKPK